MQIRPEQLQKAMAAAKARHRTHPGDNDSHWLDRRGKYYSEYIGCLGEILFRDYIMKIRSFQPSAWSGAFAPLADKRCDLKNMPPWDARVNGWTVEVKTIPPGINHRHLLVKKAEFKPVDYYLAVKLINDSSFAFAGYAVKKDLFEAGLTDKFGKDLCYALPIERLRPLSLLCWLPPKEQVSKYQ